MNGELRKSLTDLIDETLLELEELKKSRFEASEIEMKGPGEGIAGKPSDGDLHAKAEDKAEDEEEEKAKKAEHDEEEDEEEAKKAEDKDDEEEDEEDEEEAKKADHDDPADKEDVKRKLKGILGGHEGASEMGKADKKEPHKEDPKHEEKEKKLAEKLLAMHKGEMKKSVEESETLLKSFVEERVKPLEDKLSTILSLVNKIAEQPVQPKGATSGAMPLMKSAEEGRETLSKSELASKLFELKKTGTKVDSLDITRAEMGQDLVKIMDKYKLS